MSADTNLDIFKEEKWCTYRGERYTVRDNGAVLREPSTTTRKRSLDGRWTFGTRSASDGYMSISGHKVHRIVATAFLGEQPSSGHVVDHIDTNRSNNRPANLRWVTRLENILLNPITARRVEALYGSIEEFLADPRNPKNGTLSPEFEWMRTVSQAEATYSLKRMLAWAKSDRPSQGGSLGTWIFGRSVPPVEAPPPELVLSKTLGAVQRNWKVPAEFPLCPSTAEEAPLARYYERLAPGKVAAVSPYTTTLVDKAAISEDGAKVYILGSHGEDAIKPWSLACVTFEDGKFVHENLGTFFSYEGAEKALVLAQGLPWEGEDTIDDYC